MINYFQKKKIHEQLKKNRENITIDKAEKDIREMLVLNGFTTSEIAALLFTIMRNVLLSESNSQILTDIGIKDLSLDTVMEIHKQLIKEYLNGLNDTKSAPKT